MKARRVDILISNPNHHWQMVRPIVRALRSTGTPVRVISLCEFRRMSTPERAIALEGAEVLKLPGFQSAGLKTSSGQQSLGSSNSRKRKLVQRLVWHTYLRPAWKRALADGKTCALLLLNDFAYPNNYLVNRLHQLRVPFFLLQEGIRFPLPNEPEEVGAGGYGTMGSRKLFAWGNNSMEYFRSLPLHHDTEVTVAGCPRFDTLVGRDFGDSVLQLRTSYPTGTYQLGFFSNPIDDQGFCTTTEKMALVERFLQKSVPTVQDKDGRIWIKLHPREDAAAFQKLIDANNWSSCVSLVEGDIFSIIKAVDAAVVLASTVGLEALLLDRPLAVLALPHYGHVFDYVARRGALGLNLDDADYATALADFLQRKSLSPEAHTYVANSIGNLGHSADFIARTILEGC